MRSCHEVSSFPLPFVLTLLGPSCAGPAEVNGPFILYLTLVVPGIFSEASSVKQVSKACSKDSRV